MAGRSSTLVQGKIIEASQTTQYTSTRVITTIDKCTAVNFSGGAESISISLVEAGGTVGDANTIVIDKTLEAGECYTFPEIVGHTLEVSDFVSTLASTANTISLRMSGRKQT